MQVDTCQVSIGCEPEVTPEANDKHDANFVAASVHSKLAGDVHLCFQARMSVAHHSLAAHQQTGMPCCYTPSVTMLHISDAECVSSACLVGILYATIFHVNK